MIDSSITLTTAPREQNSVAYIISCMRLQIIDCHCALETGGAMLTFRFRIFFKESRSMEFPVTFFFADKRLINHVVRIISVLDVDLCELMCYQEPNCVSFNFRKKPENGEVIHRCELNNSTHLEHDSEFKYSSLFFYRGAKVRVSELQPSSV